MDSISGHGGDCAGPGCKALNRVCACVNTGCISTTMSGLSPVYKCHLVFCIELYHGNVMYFHYCITSPRPVGPLSMIGGHALSADVTDECACAPELTQPSTASPVSSVNDVRRRFLMHALCYCCCCF